MIFNYENYGIDSYYFWDASITSHPDFKKLCKKLSESNKNIKWIGLARIDELDEMTIRCLSESNCKAIEVGIEALESETLNKISKGVDVNKIFKTVELLKRYNINIEGSFVIGLPGDTEEILEKRIQLAQSLRLDYYRWHNYQFPSKTLNKSTHNIKYYEWIELDLNIPNHLIKKVIQKTRLGYFDMHIADKTFNDRLSQFPDIRIENLYVKQIIEYTYDAIKRTNDLSQDKAFHAPFI